MDWLFFAASKTIGMVARIETWLILGLLLALLAQLRGRRQAALRWTTASLGLVLVLTVFPLGDLLLLPLESQYPPEPPLVTAPFGIIVLGGAEETGAAEAWGGTQFNDAGERLIAGAQLAQRYPEAKLIFTGGISRLGDDGGAVGPAQQAHDLWISLGIAPDRIFLEQKSRNTTENATLSYALFQPVAAQNWVLVTSAFHMPRAMESFQRAGWQGVVAWPVDYRSGDLAQGATWRFDSALTGANKAFKEYVGLMVYCMVGK